MTGTPRDRALIDALQRKGFCVIIRPTDDGRIRARAYSLRGVHEDVEVYADSEITALEQLATRIGVPLPGRDAADRTPTPPRLPLDRPRD